MAYTEIANKFVEHYYTMHDTPNRKAELAPLYHDQATLIFEGDERRGKMSIMEKHMKMTALTSHAVTKIDSMPALQGLLVVVIGQIKTDDDKPLGYTHVFVLTAERDSFFIVNEVFRLGIHNF